MERFFDKANDFTFYITYMNTVYMVGFTLYCLYPQNKEGILPVATLSIALYVLHRSMSASDVAPEVTILSLAL